MKCQNCTYYCRGHDPENSGLYLWELSPCKACYKVLAQAKQEERRIKNEEKRQRRKLKAEKE